MVSLPLGTHIRDLVDRPVKTSYRSFPSSLFSVSLMSGRGESARLIAKETQFRSFSVKVPLFTKRLRDLFLERSEIVPRQSDGRPEGSHNKQLILSHRKK